MSTRRPYPKVPEQIHFKKPVQKMPSLGPQDRATQVKLEKLLEEWITGTFIKKVECFTKMHGYMGGHPAAQEQLVLMLQKEIRYKKKFDAEAKVRADARADQKAWEEEYDRESNWGW